VGSDDEMDKEKKRADAAGKRDQERQERMRVD
jgi:hypothetical protein